MIKGNTFSRADNEDGGFCRYDQNAIDNMFYCPIDETCECRDCEYYERIEEDEEE